MSLRANVAAAALGFCIAVFAWAFLLPGLILRVEPDRIAPRGGNALAWVITGPAFLPESLIPGDDSADRARSGLLLLEEGRPLGPAHSLHDDIPNAGSGRYSHWAGTLVRRRAADSAARLANPMLILQIG